LLEEQRALFNGVLSDKTLGWQGALLVVNSAKMGCHWPQHCPPSMTQVIELFTSGSTGQPKRVVKSIASLDQKPGLPHALPNGWRAVESLPPSSHNICTA
jgi:hypothetical protein